MEFLVIIDMQPLFSASQDKSVLRNVCKEIKKAKKRNDYIIVVELGQACNTASRTDYRIISAIAQYSPTLFVTKIGQDGSIEICEALDRNLFNQTHRMPETTFRFVGVNATLCVLATVKGLAKQLPQANIQVVRKACGEPFSKTPTKCRYQTMMPANALVL